VRGISGNLHGYMGGHYTGVKMLASAVEIQPIKRNDSSTACRDYA
jgi:hypothetical protein